MARALSEVYWTGSSLSTFAAANAFSINPRVPTKPLAYLRKLCSGYLIPTDYPVGWLATESADPHDP